MAKQTPRQSFVAGFAHPGRNVVMLEIKPGSVVADFGAGSGRYALELAKAVGSAGQVYAIDVHADLLRRIKNEADRQGVKNIEIIVGDVSRAHGTKLRTRSVGLVLMSNILFQLEHKAAAFAEAHRILEPGGRLVIIDWSEQAGRIGPARDHIYKLEDAVREATANHFHFSDQFPAGAHHYGLMFNAI